MTRLYHPFASRIHFESIEIFLLHLTLKARQSRFLELNHLQTQDSTLEILVLGEDHHAVSAAGIALSVASLSFQVFAGCVKGFVLPSSTQKFGNDASFLRTMLNMEEYRFVQWVDKVGLTSPDGKMLPLINQALADELMVQLRDRLGCVKLKE